jgi:hypothetical protein
MGRILFYGTGGLAYAQDALSTNFVGARAYPDAVESEGFTSSWH